MASVRPSPDRLVSVVIPARDEAASIGATVAAVLAQAAPGPVVEDSVTVEVVVVDDGSTDGTAAAARAAGARVVSLPAGSGGAGRGNPAAARNRGAAAAAGDPIVFLDADCTPAPGWLAALLAAHDAGAAAVGGAIDLPPGLPATARCDYYCGFYLVHSRRPAGPVPHHPPPNLSVRRAPFFATSGFIERQPFAYTNEERVFEAEMARAGHRIWFEPRARVVHHNRPGLRNLLKRNYRWAYTALPAKHETGAARLAWLWRRPWLVVAGSGLLALAHTAFIVGCWARAGVFEPLVMLPWVLLSRLAYAAGMSIGGARWLAAGRRPDAELSPRWL